MTDQTDPSSGLLQAVLKALPVALAVYDSQHRLVLTSDLAFTWAGLNPTIMPVGSSFAEVVRVLAWNGLYGAGDPEQIARAVLEIDRSKSHVRVAGSSAGRIGLIESRPLPGGGFLTCTADVTTLNKARTESADRARLVEAMLMRLQAGVAAFDGDLRISLSNPAYEQVIGLPSGTIRTGMPHSEILALLEQRGEMDPADRAAIAARTASGQFLSGTVQRKRPTGEVLRIGKQPLPQGGFVVELADVTPLKRAETEAQGRAALLVGVLEALPHGICMFGPDRRVEMFNQAYAHIMEGSPARVGELLEDVVSRRLAEGEFTAEEADLIRRRPGLGAEEGVLVHTRPNGTAVESRVAPLPNGGHISVLTDITALHRAKSESRHRAAVMETMLTSMRQGIVLYGPDRRLLAVSARTPDLIGLPASSLTPGRHVDEVVGDQLERGQLPPEAGGRIISFDRSQSSRYRRSSPDGRVIEVTSDPTPDGGFAVTFTDVSQDYRIQAELERARQAAEAASEAKSRFLATMSHELRTPLNAIIGFSEAILAERDRGRLEDYAGSVNDAGRKLLLLIDDILDVARSQTGTLEMVEAPVAIAPLLRQAAAEIADQARQAGLHFDMDLPGDLPALCCDARRLLQLLQNLLSNAVKFTPPGGRITLSAERTREGLAISVTDSGIGIAPEDRERVFEPFTQVDNSLARRFHGSGLGLYLARTLAMALGGTLALEAPPGPGTLVVLRFPAARLTGQADDPERGPAAGSPYPGP